MRGCIQALCFELSANGCGWALVLAIKIAGTSYTSLQASPIIRLGQAKDLHKNAPSILDC